MKQKHPCRVFHCFRLRSWNACRICSSLWPEMGECLVHLWEQCPATARASGHRGRRVPVSVYPQCHVPHGLLTAGKRGHHRLCSTLSSSALKAVGSCIQLEEGFFTGGWLCRPRAAGGTRVLFSVLVASSSVAVWSGEVWGCVASGAGRAGCSRSAGPLSLGLPPSVAALVELGAPTGMGVDLHHMRMRGPRGIRVLKLHGKFTGAERGTSFSSKHMCPSPLFNSGTYKN